MTVKACSISAEKVYPMTITPSNPINPRYYSTFDCHGTCLLTPQFSE
jgi:hypothetical protein